MARTQLRTVSGKDPGGDAAERSPRLETAIRRVGDEVHRLNLAIAGAVDAGATVELVRCSRYHGGDGRWGDQMVPVVILPDSGARGEDPGA